MIDFILLYKIEWTDKHPAFGVIGATLSALACLALLGATK
jgi:flagellar motor component MotA